MWLAGQGWGRLVHPLVAIGLGRGCFRRDCFRDRRRTLGQWELIEEQACYLAGSIAIALDAADQSLTVMIDFNE